MPKKLEPSDITNYAAIAFGSLRRKTGASSRALARYLEGRGAKVSASLLTAWERGESVPNLTTLCTYLSALDLSLGEFEDFLILIREQDQEEID